MQDEKKRIEIHIRKFALENLERPVKVIIRASNQSLPSNALRSAINSGKLFLGVFGGSLAVSWKRKGEKQV